MAFDLNPVAVTAASLLRAIDAANWTTRTELAEAAGRKRSNIARDIAILVNADLVEERGDDACGRPVVLTDAGRAQLAALDRAANPDAAGALTALHGDLEPHPLNPRKDFDTAEAEEALDELRVSIVKSGLLQPIVVRPQPTPGKWWIVAGERRFRAIGQAISDGDWDEDQPIAITVRDVDDRDHLLLALNENLQRSNMKAIEEGVAFNAAVQDFGMSTEDLANRTGKSQRYVQQRIALLKLDPVDQDRMRLPKDHPDFLSFKAARALTQTPRAPIADAAEDRIATLTARYTLPDPKRPQAVPLLRIEIGRHDDGTWSFATGRSDGQGNGGGYGLPFVEARRRAIPSEREALINAVSELRQKEVDSGSVDRKRIAWLDDVLAGRAGPDAPAAAAEDADGQAAAMPAGGEPGSRPAAPIDEAAAFEASLSDREALAFVELADRAESHPAADPELAANGYTEVDDRISQDGVSAALVRKGALGIRYRGGERPNARAYLTSNGGRAWLERIGFFSHREDALFEMRVRVFGLDRAVEAKADGRYLTAWLNPEDCQAEAGQTLEPAARQDGFAAQSEPEQPELIEATEEEKAARRARKEERERAAATDAHLDKLNTRLAEWCAGERAAGRTDWLSAAIGTWDHSTPETPSWEAVAAAVVAALAVGDGIKAIAAIALLECRLGYPGRRLKVLSEMPSDLIADIAANARAAEAKPDAA